MAKPTGIPIPLQNTTDNNSKILLTLSYMKGGLAKQWADGYINTHVIGAAITLLLHTIHN
jgi:hypothetical protein